jgi:hypothetical protein
MGVHEPASWGMQVTPLHVSPGQHDAVAHELPMSAQHLVPWHVSPVGHGHEVWLPHWFVTGPQTPPPGQVGVGQ